MPKPSYDTQQEFRDLNDFLLGIVNKLGSVDISIKYQTREGPQDTTFYHQHIELKSGGKEMIMTDDKWKSLIRIGNSYLTPLGEDFIPLTDQFQIYLNLFKKAIKVARRLESLGHEVKIEGYATRDSEKLLEKYASYLRNCAERRLEPLFSPRK